MKTSVLSTLFIAAVCANPFKVPDEPLVRARNDLEACRQAINCEVVDPQTRRETNTSLARIRYKPNMGPSSIFYRDLMARQPQEHKRADDGTIETQVSLADAKVSYGCEADERKSPPDPHAMLGHLDQVCKSTGSCIEDESYESEIKVVDSSGDLVDATWTLTGDGEYPRELQSAFVQAVQALAGTGFESKSIEFKVSDWETGMPSYYNCNSVKQTGEYHVSRYVWIDGNKVLQGFIIAKVSIKEEDGGMCDALEPVITAGEMAAAIPEIGEVIAGIFGGISVLCDIIG